MLSVQQQVTGNSRLLYFYNMPVILKKLLAEPIIQFILSGAVLFLLVSYVQQHRDLKQREIIIDSDRVTRMIMNYKTQTGNLPSKEQLDALLDDYISEEIYFREAKKLGLDQDDEIIRRRLSQKLAFMQSDLADIKIPDEEELLQFYKNNPSLFLQDAMVSFTHIYFSTDNSNDSIARQRALAVLQTVKKKNLRRSPESGDRFPLQYDYMDQAEPDIRQNFGNNAFSDTLFHSAINTWAGPVPSGYGWHLIFVTKRNSAALKDFASIKDEVKIRYLEAAKAEHDKQAFEKLRSQYIIHRAYLETK